MATRPGDLDPGALTFLTRAEGLSLDQLLNEEAGLLGLSGTSGDMRTLLDADDANARLAIDVYCYRAGKCIGAYLATLGGAEAILFRGGVGEHAWLVHAKILTGLERLGIALDSVANRATIGSEMRVSNPSSEVEVWVIPVDEAAVLAQAALAMIVSSKTVSVQKDRS